MLPKPSHLSAEYGAWFNDPGIVEAYPNRPPYPGEAIETLVGLIADTPRVVLDVGCGTGDIARRLAETVDRVDAVDFSAGMIERGKYLPGGDHPRLNWVLGRAEDAPLSPPYALITAGESLHWMAWDLALPRFAAALTPRGVLAIVERNWDRSAAVRSRLQPIFREYSPVRDFQPYDLIDELERRHLFQRIGAMRTRPVPWRPSIDEYLACRYSQRGFSRDRMGPATTAAFDRAIRQALEDLRQEGAIQTRDGKLDLDVEATVNWGKPLSGSYTTS